MSAAHDGRGTISRRAALLGVAGLGVAGLAATAVRRGGTGW
jgi:hypothetical protein